MKVDVINLDADRRPARSSSIRTVFGIEAMRSDILHRVVRWQLAKRRAGTHKIKIRNEVTRRTARRCTSRRAPAAPVTARAAAPQFGGGAKALRPGGRAATRIDLPRRSARWRCSSRSRKAKPTAR